MSLLDQRGDNLVDLVEPFSGQVNAGSGGCTEFFVKPLCSFGVIIIFGLYGAFVPWFFTAIANERSLLNPAAMFPFKTAADIVAFVAGSAFGIANDKLSAGICLLAMVAVSTKIIGVNKTAAVPCIDGSVPPYFFRDRGRVFAEIFGDLTERLSFIKAIFNIDPVI